MSDLLDLLRPHGPFMGPLLFGAAINLLRYLIVAGIAFAVWYRDSRAPRRRWKLQDLIPGRKQIKREILYSIGSTLVFGLVNGVLFGYGIFQHTQVYRQVADFGWAYFWFSMLLMAIVHDTYFYWMHRLMHHRALFRYFHRVHHLSTNPTPWASYAFHPLEAVVEAGAIVLIIFIVPTQMWALLIFETISIAINVYGHLGYELYPPNWSRHWFGRWINTSVAHNTHHATARHNYGLYFLFWDRLCGTIDPAYDERYARAHGLHMSTQPLDAAIGNRQQV